MGERRLERWLLGLLLLSIFVLGLNDLADTDTWTHLHLGRTILEMGGFPQGEPHIYTAAGREFQYTSWLYGVVYYLLWNHLGVAAMVLFTALLATAVFLVWYRWLRLHGVAAELAVVLLVVTAILCRARFIVRPDLVAMLCLATSVYALDSFVISGKRTGLWLLPLVHLLWANVHSSVILMPIPFIAVGAGQLGQELLRRMGARYAPIHRATLERITLVFLVCVLATLLNPNGVAQWLYGPMMLNVPIYKQTIRELAAPSWATFKLPFVLIGILLAAVVSQWLVLRRLRRWPLLAPILLTLPFIYGALDSIRFTFLLALVAGPVVALSLNEIFVAMPKPLARLQPGVRGAITTLLAVGVVGTSFMIGFPGWRWGVGVDYRLTPEPALAFMDSLGVEGGTFNTFGWGGYVLWRDEGRRTVYADTRANIAPTFLRDMQHARMAPARFDQLQVGFGFESALISYPVIMSHAWGERDAGLDNTAWRLCYWDDLSMLYLRRDGPYADWVDHACYEHVRPANGMRDLAQQLMQPGLAEALRSELERAVRSTDSTRAKTLLGLLYLEQHEQPEEAVRLMSEAAADCGWYCYAGLKVGLARAQARTGRVDEAVESYRGLLNESPSVHLAHDLAMVQLQDHRLSDAAETLENALALDSTFARGYAALESVYRQQDRQEDIETLRQRWADATGAGRAREAFSQAVRAYTAKDFDRAETLFNESLQLNPNNAAAHSNLGYIHLDRNDPQAAARHQRQALQVDTQFANAHYGLALALVALGDSVAARSHWERYLELDPQGAFAQQARHKLEMLPR